MIFLFFDDSAAWSLDLKIAPKATERPLYGGFSMWSKHTPGTVGNRTP